MENIGYIELCLLFEQADDGLRQVTLQPMQAIAPLIIGASVLCGTSLLQPETAQALTPGETIQLGSQSDKVREIQIHLRDWGFPLNPNKRLAVDGVFGEATRVAVLEFQQYHKLKPDGIVGNATYPILSNPPNYPSQPLKRGDVNDSVRDVQTYLNQLGHPLVVDGIFGPQTEQAVKDFQTKYRDEYNLKPTGIVDIRLYKILLDVSQPVHYGGDYTSQVSTTGGKTKKTPPPPPPN
ncbi:MAG: peptidoglycan-binding protein [Oscillatoriales cyanobacterium C42_A2020_001]|nr:peptidoglycan-binding protein [Leptolyngbyaceae cyanobacterium C42_A2020_001]